MFHPFRFPYYVKLDKFLQTAHVPDFNILIWTNKQTVTRALEPTVLPARIASCAVGPSAVDLLLSWLLSCFILETFKWNYKDSLPYICMLFFFVVVQPCGSFFML